MFLPILIENRGKNTLFLKVYINSVNNGLPNIDKNIDKKSRVNGLKILKLKKSDQNFLKI